MSLFTVVAVLSAGCVSSDSSGQSAPSTARNTQKSQELKKPANTQSLAARHLVTKLAQAGLEPKELGPAQISLDDSSRFPEEARSTMVVRISDADGNSEAMTFVEFGSWKAAAKLDAKPINGFAVRNWFVLGTASNYFVDLVTNALGS
jgi:hypothetical protein